jgi:PAS domain S-box-containing protein
MANAAKNALLDSEQLLFTTEHRAIWLVAIVGLSLSLAALWLIRQQLDAHKLLDFEWVTHNRIRAINNGVDNGLLAVTSIRDFYMASGDVGPKEFQLLAESQLKRYHGIQMLMWISRTGQGERVRPQPTQDISGEGGSVQQHPRYFTLNSVASRAEHFYVANIVPQQEAKFDLSSDPDLVKLLEQARNSGRMAASGPIEIMTEGGKTEFGFMAGLPVYPRLADVDTPGKQREPPLGFVVGLFKLNELVSESIALLEPRGVEILLVDGTAASDQQFLYFYSSRLAPRDVNSINYLDWLNREEKVRVSEIIQVADREWNIICGQTDTFRSAEAFQKGPWAVMITGLLFTMLISFYLVHIKKNTEERMAMQQQLAEREELFRQMTETVDEVFWAITADATMLLYLSPAYETIFGVSSGQQDQQGLLILNSLSQSDQSWLMKALEQIRRSNTVQELIHRVNREDGSTRWVRTRGFPVNDERGEVYRIVGFIEDITEKKLADEALKESEAKLRDMFQQSPDIIMTVDERGKILLMNRSIPELPAERAIGRNSLALMPYGFRKWFRRGLKNVFRKGASPQFEYSADDGTFWEGRIVPIRADGPVTAAMVIASDVTEKRSLEIQAQRNARLASIGVLSAGVAHEINNPNNAINFNAGLVSRAWGDIEPILAEYFEEQGDFALGGLAYSEARDTFPQLLSEITRNSERIRSIVQNLKHMARQGTGKLTEDVDIQQVLESTLMILHNQIQKYTDVCTLDVPDGLPRVKGNSQQLEQVFINVLLNALQALPERSHGIFISAGFNPDTDNLEIKVRDEGCGISERDLGRLTEPFFTTRTDAGGTGLGLSITRSIMEKHGGNLTFESEPGKGTTVSIRIPSTQSG